MSITITQVRNAVSLHADNLRMNVEIKHPQYGWIPYTVDPADTDTTINNDVIMSLIGSDFAAHVSLSEDEVSSQKAQSLRLKRDELLTASDWTQVSDAPVNQAAWATYRQALRDIPQQQGFPCEIAWPAKP